MNFPNLIKDICLEENIELKMISKNWVAALTKNGVTRCISGYRFPLNNHAIGSILDDKYALYDLCKLKNIPIIEHSILFNPSSKLGADTPKLIEDYFNKYQGDVVIKPNNGTEGHDVYHLKNIQTLKEKCNELFQNNFSISICPFYQIDSEYRVVVLDGEVRLIFEKIRPTVIGDGKKTIKDLLLELNYEYFKKKTFDNDYNQVLKKDERYTYDWRFNLSRGATARLVTDEDLVNKLTKMALEITKTLGVGFVSVDIIKCNYGYLLMEINSGVCINKVTNFIDKDLKITKRIYKDAIKKMFD